MLLVISSFPITPGDLAVLWRQVADGFVQGDMEYPPKKEVSTRNSSYRDNTFEPYKHHVAMNVVSSTLFINIHITLTIGQELCESN